MKKIYKSIFFLAAACFLGFSYSGAYFSSSVLISDNGISTAKIVIPGKIVINEIYYDVSPDKGSEPNDEWIELFNSGDVAVTVKGWSITDNSLTRTINAKESISPHSYVLVSKDHSVWNNYDSLPQSIDFIELGKNIGNGLSNAGDLIILKDTDGNIIDQVSYGNNAEIFNPPCTDVAEGHSLERSSAGKDTDSASDFIDQPNPSPGAAL